MAYDVAKLLSCRKPNSMRFSPKSGRQYPRWRSRRHRDRRSGHHVQSQYRAFVSHFAWQGKVFDAKKGVLKNKILPFGLNAIIAKVYKGPSWLDGKECIVLDYSDTSIIAQWIRDEIRQIEPGLYLGKVYWDKTRLIDFALKFKRRCQIEFTIATRPSDGVAGLAYYGLAMIQMCRQFLSFSCSEH